MRKEKKDKKNKVKNKSKWNPLLTALSVFAGVTLISGGTVLGVYLTGGFDEKVVYPESIAIEYDNTLFNNGQLEVGVSPDFKPEEKQTFKLKITTPTSKVNKKKVTLSFSQDQYNTPDSAGYISNTIIRLPQVVSLGQEFEVELLTENLKASETSTEYILDENGSYIDWIKGGISTIKAQSADNQMSPLSLKIAVDVPVYKTETQIIDSNGQLVEQVVTNETFYVKSKFIPAKSQYMYSDDKSAMAENEWRTKKTFFESRNTTAITPVYDDNYNLHFLVGNEPANNIEINAYTYQTAKEQLDYEKTLSDGLSATDYYIRMLENIASKTSTDKVTKTNLMVGEASVGNYTVSKHSQTIEMQVGKNLRLFMNKYGYYADADYLGVDVYSNNGAILDGMLKNIAIAFVADGVDATTGATAYLSVNGENKDNYVLIDGIKYYKPTLSGLNPRFSFWDLTPIKEKTVQIKTVLLIDDGNEEKPFEIAGQEVTYTLNLDIKEHKEKALSWTDTSEINIMLDYDADGKVIPQTINLSKLTNVPSENIYQDVIFFACFGTQDKASYEETINSVLGASSYDYGKSGVYATENGNFTLFALEGNSITLYSTGEFTLYYATVVANNGNYELDSDGLYKVALMCEGNIRVTCEKSLNDESISAGILNTDGFVASENGEVSINQGSEKTFSVKFTIGKESVPVFEDEYRKGYMTPKIYDNVNNDKTSLFIIDSKSFLIDAQTGEGVLEYKFKVKSAVQIENLNGIYLGSVSLEYNDSNERNIIWSFPLSNEQNVCIYNPVSTSISIDQGSGYEFANVLNGKEQVKVEQSLQTDGSFLTTIKVKVGAIERTYTINEFLQALVGIDSYRVVITDQKLKTDTLKGQWTFVVSGGDAGVISISSDGKSFVFKNTDKESVNVKITISSADKNVSIADNDQQIDFSIVSEGITHIAYSNTLDTYDATINENEKTSNIASAVVQKYGAVGQGADEGKDIILSDLIKFYIADGDQEYTKFSFKFNPQYISQSSLSEIQIIDLFGGDGMLTLYTDENTALDFSSNDESVIRNTLYSTEIYKIHINKNFAISPTLKFTISDSVGAVNTSFDLTLLSNIAVSSENYPLSGDTLYASEELVIENTVSNHYLNKSDFTFANALYIDNTEYYVIYDYNDNRYVLTSQVQEKGDYVAKFKQGKIVFEDFWDTEIEEYRIYFQPEGANYYALNHGITFKVTRDLEVKSKNANYYILGASINSPIGDYVSVSRKSNGEMLSSSVLNLTYEFSEYLSCDDGNVGKKANTDFFFGYNQTSLTSTLKIYLPSSALLTEIPVDIKLYKTDDIYREIALSLQSKNETSISAQSQIVGDVEYMMVDMSSITSWKLGYLNNTTYWLDPSNRDYNSQSMNRVYEVNGVNDLTIRLKRQSKLLAGLGDDTVYMAIKVYGSDKKSEVLATLHVPMILSLMGYESILYENEKFEIADNRKLETALLSPEDLYNKGIYNEIEAGKLTQILYEYDYNENVTKGGLYTLEGFTPTIKNYSFDSALLDNYQELIKTLVTGKKEVTIDATTTEIQTYGNLTLNHLAVDEDVYLAFEYTLEKSDIGIKQTLYYLVKVNPDMTVEDPVYAYNGTSEYLTQTVNKEGSIHIEKIFDNYTLNEGYKRFNISKNLNLTKISENVVDELTITVNSDSARIRFKYEDKEVFTPTVFAKGDHVIDLGSADYFNTTLSEQIPVNIMIMEGDAIINYNGEEIFRTLEFKNVIESVKVGDETTCKTEEEWSEYISLYFSADYSTLYYRPKVEDAIEITLKHIYAGSASDTDLSVVGGDQTYKLIINGTSSNYSIKFIEGQNEDVLTKKVVDIENGSIDVYDNLTIQLIENDEAGSSQTGTIVPDLLQIQIISGGQYLDDRNFGTLDGKVNYDDFKGYNRSTGQFTLTLKDYIDSDQTVYFAIFTEQGYLARLAVNLKANAKFKALLTELEGGNAYPFSELFEIKLDENKVTSFKSIEGEVMSGDKDYATWENGSLEIADLLDNREITVSIKITFDNGNIFIFSQTFALKANLSKISSYTSTNKVIAGQEHEVELSKLYTGTPNVGEEGTSTIILSAQSSSPAFDNIYKDDDGKWKIQTRYVSTGVTVSATITVNIYYNAVIKADNTIESYKALQSYKVIYAFVVEPSVEITPNYPVPSDEKLEFEFVEDGITFNGILTNFFGHNPIFGTEGNNRIVMKNSTTAGVYDNNINYTADGFKTSDITIIVSSLQNASVYVKGSTKPHYLVNSIVASDANVTFKRGTYSDKNGNYEDSGNDSIIEFTITYQEVSKVYTIYVIKNSLSVKLNQVSNYVGSGEFKESETTTTSVNYETVYIDKTNIQNMFARERMVYVEMSDTMATYSDEYYLVFKDQGADAESEEDDVYYASYPIYFSTADQGKNLYFDLGVSMSGKEFVGAYLTSSFENKGLGISNNVLSVNTEIVNDGSSVPTLIKSLTNQAYNLFEFGNVTLANRVQLVYGQIEGRDILVDYDWYGNCINNLTIATSQKVGDIDKSVPITSFVRNDGSSFSHSFNINYYYRPNIDIAVSEEATDTINYLELEVNKEYLSMAELFGVHHPTNNKIISPSDFATGTTTLSFETLKYSYNPTGDDRIEIAETYLLHLKLTSTGFKKTASESDPNTIYLFYAGKENASHNISDYTLLPLGADNDGDFVLCKITYAINSESSQFVKEFYVVVKIVPDYNVTFGDSADNATIESDGSISNLNNKMTINETEKIENSVYFKDFALTGDNAYLSIKHKNGSSTNVELSAINFSTTMPISYRNDSTEFNNSGNAKNKIFYANSPNLKDENGDVWKEVELETGYQYQLKEETKAVFSRVKEVIFGNQYYMITGVDPYGYTFKLYFILESIGDTPSVDGTVSLIENGYFDIGAQYQYLTIEKDSSNLYYINSNIVAPTSKDANVRLINIKGIEAWLFSKDYAAEENNEEKYLKYEKDDKGNADGYTLAEDKTTGEAIAMNKTDIGYLESPKIKYLTIDGMAIYDPNDSKEPIANLNNPTIPNSAMHFATADSTAGFFNGLSPRSSYDLLIDSDNDGTPDNATNLWQIPRLTNTDIYQGANSAEVTLIITLKYSNGDIVEYYECPVKVNLIRDIAIEQTDAKVTRDAQAIDLARQFKVPFGDDNLVETEGKVTFTNDTLEVLISANSTASFEMTLSRKVSGEWIEIGNATVTISNTGRDFLRTEYISLSQYFKKNVASGDKVTIKNYQYSKFFYIKEGNITGATTEEETTKTVEFTIGNITNDYIYIEHSSLLEKNSYHNVTKYYIMNCKIGSEENYTTYSYQVSRDYYVTGYYYKMLQEFITEVGFTINATAGDSANIANWNAYTANEITYEAFSLRNAVYEDGVLDMSEEKSQETYDYIKFFIDKSADTTSGMSIGSAEIGEDDGEITLGSTFNENQYIKVVLKMAVSGPDRILASAKGADGAGDATYLTLGTLRLSTIRQASTEN